jgi:ribose transport system substrate-binding protein
MEEDMKLMKRLLSAGMALALTSAVATAQDWLPEGADVSSVKVGVTTIGPSVNSYAATYVEEFERYSKELGLDIIMLDSQADPARQSNQVQDLIAQQVDVMVIWPINAQAIVPAVRQAHARGIPIVISNSKIDESGKEFTKTFTGPDDYTQAKKAGELMIDALDGKGNVVIVGGTPGYTVSNLREQGFRDALEGTDIKVIDAQPANWSRERAQSLMENYITRFGSDINGVYSADAGMGTGALAAVQAAVSDGKLPSDHGIAFTDATLFAAGYDAIKRGEYYGSILQSPKEDAQTAVRAAVLIGVGADVPELMYMKTPSVTKENVDEFERPVF